MFATRATGFILSLVVLFLLVERPAAANVAVTGYGKVFYTVDTADLGFSVSVRDADVQAAKQKHDAIHTRLSAWLTEHAYPREILSLEETILKNDRGSARDPDDDFYLARSTWSMRTSRVDELSALQADLVSIGVDEIHFVRLFSSRQRELEDQAMRQAIKDAKQKATLTAELLGAALGRPQQIRFDNTWSPGGHGIRGGSVNAGGEAGSANFVDARVSIVFELINTSENPASG